MNPDAHAPADRLERWCDRIALLGFVGIVALTAMIAADVLGRFLFSRPLPGVNDVSAVLVALAISACLPASLVTRRHLTITALGRALGPRWAAAADAFGAALMLGGLALIAWQLVDYTRDKLDSGNTTWILRWPTWPWWTAVTALFGASTLVQAVMLWRALCRIGRLDEEDRAA